MLDYIGFTFEDFDKGCVVIVYKLPKSSHVYYLAGGAGGKMQNEGMQNGWYAISALCPKKLWVQELFVGSIK